jgi:SsrA-binding protein
MAQKKHKSPDSAPRIVNRQARHDYQILEKIEVGIELVGSEVKSIRSGQVSLAEGYARVDPNTLQMFLHDVHIAEYKQAGPHGHDPRRTRKLLAHKREIKRIMGLLTAGSRTLVPLAMYFSRGWVKLELGVGLGKSKVDKRQDLKRTDADKAIRRAMTRRTI